MSSKYEIYVRALLDYQGELEAKAQAGKWHLVDEMRDLDRAIELAVLTDKQIKSLHCSFTLGLSHADTGELLEIPRQTVDFHVNAAIRKIASIYEHWEALEHANDIHD